MGLEIIIFVSCFQKITKPGSQKCDFLRVTDPPKNYNIIFSELVSMLVKFSENVFFRVTPNSLTMSDFKAKFILFPGKDMYGGMYDKNVFLY